LDTENDPIDEAVAAAANYLKRCYDALSMDAAGWRQTLMECSWRFASQVVALETAVGDPKLWRVKPKMHLFLELCSSGFGTCLTCMHDNAACTTFGA
jgi:hypothetical protein